MPKLTPDDAERLFSSAVDEGDPELGTLASFVREVRDTYSRAPDAATKARHLQAMAEQLAAPASVPLIRRRRRIPVGRAAVAALAGSVLVAGSALAATGHLPGPAQDAVAGLVSHVGVTLPTPSSSDNAKGDAGKARADANKQRAKDFTHAKKVWTQCVADNAAHHSGPFNPEEACGAKPTQQQFQPTRTNPAGHPDHGKGPSPQGQSGASNADEHGNSTTHPTPAAGDHANPHSSNGSVGEHGNSGH